MKQSVPVTINVCKACQLPHTIQSCSTQFQIWHVGCWHAATAQDKCACMPLSPPPKQPLFQYSIDMTSGHELVAGNLGEQGSQAEVCSLGLAPRPLLLCYTVYWGEAPFKQGISCSSSLGLAEMEHNVHLLPHQLICRQGAAVGVSHSHRRCFYGFCISHVIWGDRHQS